jgi:hypothetical protein
MKLVKIHRDFLYYHWVDRSLPWQRDIVGVHTGGLDSTHQLQDKMTSWLSFREARLIK